MSSAIASDLHESYMLARHAQELRADEYAHGYQAETDRFYGRGEYRGDAIEEPITWQTWLRSAGGEQAAWIDQCAELDREVGPVPDDEPAIEPWDLEPAPYDEPTIPARPAATSATDAFRMSGAELGARAARGDTGARAEIMRRATRRAAKRAAHAA